eukprot:CAMPEP_0174339466 /NCGR_PEP_ID=MMETSP0810-20121108/23927_1 /TAXON_ID=73025 ORGANISM="Eutreptiella gymnastica-like, Strain CCMP1594" /NCGR_SAMPLE_ID=MMETSP0810 /ASSEMBLY_ACC=CAM_ASM_000659 /LENGTH=86 /DNA_ID=CAMNT_0015460105 /DNA_START=760 /DNA_END=1020 /DNA_ORIENTATION=+
MRILPGLHFAAELAAHLYQFVALNLHPGREQRGLCARHHLMDDAVPAVVLEPNHLRVQAQRQMALGHLLLGQVKVTVREAEFGVID